MIKSSENKQQISLFIQQQVESGESLQVIYESAIAFNEMSIRMNKKHVRQHIGHIYNRHYKESPQWTFIGLKDRIESEAVIDLETYRWILIACSHVDMDEVEQDLVLRPLAKKTGVRVGVIKKDLLDYESICVTDPNWPFSVLSNGLLDPDSVFKTFRMVTWDQVVEYLRDHANPLDMGTLGQGLWDLARLKNPIVISLKRLGFIRHPGLVRIDQVTHRLFSNPNFIRYRWYDYTTEQSLRHLRWFYRKKRLKTKY